MIPGISTNFTDHDTRRCESTHNRRLNVDFREQRERRGRDSSKDGDGGEQVIGYELLVSTLARLAVIPFCRLIGEKYSTRSAARHNSACHVRGREREGREGKGGPDTILAVAQSVGQSADDLTIGRDRFGSSYTIDAGG